MSTIEIFKISVIVVVSITGGGGIVALIVKCASGWISQRMLDHYNNVHEKELEEKKTGEV